MFLKTESFEHNGVTVTLSELSALQRIEHLALMKRQAEQAESDSNRKFTVEDAIRTGAFLEPETERTKYGGVPEWPKGTDCKSAAFRFDGSNPSSPTNQSQNRNGSGIFCCVYRYRWHLCSFSVGFGCNPAPAVLYWTGISS